MPVITGTTTIHKDEWRTDPALFRKVNAAFPLGIDLDAAATAENALCPTYLCAEDNALKVDWYIPENGVNIIWLNPPFSMAHEFLKKANKEHEKGATIVCLVRADAPETAWWRDNVITKHGYLRHKVFYLYPRLNYFNTDNERVSGVTFPSCLILMGHNRAQPFYPRWINWQKYIDFKYLFN
jgi:phage N-6-adenine-methyltransferase